MEDEEENPDEGLYNTDGLVWGLYSHLWRKTHRGQPCPNINLPTTVIYKNARPITWYFTSLKDNKIYRKQRRKVVGQLIWDAMSAGQEPDVDVCAWFSGNMTLLASQPKKTKGIQPLDEQYELHPKEETKESASFEYLPSERVHHLTYPGQYTVILEQIYDGILQKFVAPREAHDSIIRAIWSPTACVCERRTNRNVLTDQTKPLSSRIASFDHANFWLNSHQVLPEGSVVVERLTTQCEAVVNHLRDTTSGKVSVARMELYFKLDAHNRIWLMYCNTLRLDPTVFAIDRSPSMQREMPHRQYSLRDPAKHDDETRMVWDDNPFMCALTGKTCSGRQRVDVSYKLLIQAWFKEITELANENDRIGALDNIPPAIRRANPNITRDYYLRMRAQPVFLMKTAPISADAAVTLAPAAAADLARTIARPTAELAKSAGGAALAEPKPIIATAHPKDPLSVLIERRQRGPGHRPPVLSSVRLVPGSKETDNGLLYEPGTVLPQDLLPRPRSPPTMLPAYSPGTTKRILPAASRSACFAAKTSPFVQSGPVTGGAAVWSGTFPQQHHPHNSLYPLYNSTSLPAPHTHPSMQGGTGSSSVPVWGVPGPNRVPSPQGSPLQPGGSKKSLPKPLFVAKPRAVPLHEPRKSQHSPGRLAVEAFEAELLAPQGLPTAGYHQEFDVYMPKATKRRSARPHQGHTDNTATKKGSKGGPQSLQAMKDAYSSAEAATQELLAQAHEFLKEPGAPIKSSSPSQASGIANSQQDNHEGLTANGGPTAPSNGRRAGHGGAKAAPGGESLTKDENEFLSEALEKYQ